MQAPFSLGALRGYTGTNQSRFLVSGMSPSDPPPKDDDPEWVLPAQIPFAELKREDLEECIYWLLDAMGARDLEWRKGGVGGGAADGGRDLEATFYEPDADGALSPITWWVECKGRGGTVEPQAVKEAAVNAQARADLGVLVIATNSTFSNPTRDWVREFQTSHPKIRILLWDQVTLERLISRQPSVVLRLFSQALSFSGRLRAAEERFWNRLEYSPTGALETLWAERAQLDIDPMAAFALIANEFSGGSIVTRPWGGHLDGLVRLEALQMGLVNAGYLVLRCNRVGAPHQPIVRTLAYLILVALDLYEPSAVARLVLSLTTEMNGVEVPRHVSDYILLPVLGQLQSEVQDVCAADCRRMSADRRRVRSFEGDDLELYWSRLGDKGSTPPDEPTSRLRLESLKEPCKVGFPVSETFCCPLFEIEPDLDTVERLFAIIERVATARAQGVSRRAALLADAD